MTTTETETETSDDTTRAPGYDQRKTLAKQYGRMLRYVPGGGLFLKLIHLSVRLTYPAFNALGTLTRQRERTDRWIDESEEMFDVYYSAYRGELDSD